MKTIALIGAESTGKTTTAMMIAGRLRTRGHKADVCYEAGKVLPFPTELLDTSLDAWAWRIAHKIEQESVMRLQPHVDFLVCDRTPLDFACYAQAKLGASPVDVSWEWLLRYDHVYFFPIAGTQYIEDGFRAPLAQNTWRSEVERRLRGYAARLPQDKVVWVDHYKTMRERAEFVYHHVLHTFFGESRPMRAYEQVTLWLRSRGHRVIEVLPQGSNSLNRFHAPSDNDDIDMMVIVDGDASYAIEVRKDYLAHKEQLENIVQADLDVLITPRGMEAHEV